MKDLTHFVDADFLHFAGFDEGNIFTLTKNLTDYRVHHGRYRGGDMVIIEGVKKGNDGRNRKEWYFGILVDRRSPESKSLTPEDMPEIESLITRKRRTAGRNLPNLIDSYKSWRTYVLPYMSS